MEFRKMVTITLCTRQQKRHWCIEQSYGLCGRIHPSTLLTDIIKQFLNILNFKLFFSSFPVIHQYIQSDKCYGKLEEKLNSAVTLKLKIKKLQKLVENTLLLQVQLPFTLSVLNQKSKIFRAKKKYRDYFMQLSLHNGETMIYSCVC